VQFGLPRAIAVCRRSGYYYVADEIPGGIRKIIANSRCTANPRAGTKRGAENSFFPLHVWDDIMSHSTLGTLAHLAQVSTSIHPSAMLHMRGYVTTVSTNNLTSSIAIWQKRGILFAVSEHGIVKANPQGTSAWDFREFAGNIHCPGDSDGNGGAALFSFPGGMEVDERDGSLYVADSFNHKIRRISPNGDVSTLAGNIYENLDGPARSACFRVPTDVAVDGRDGTIYVADFGNNAIRKISHGNVTTVRERTGDAVQFNNPRGILLDTNNNVLYIAEDHAIRVLPL